MTIKILDNGLISKAGHHYSFNRQLWQENKDIHVYAFKNVSPEIVAEGWTTGAFTDWTYIQHSADPQLAWLDSFLRNNETFYEDLDGVGLADGDVVLVHTVTPAILYGLAQYLRRKALKVKLKLIIGLPGIRDNQGNPTTNAYLFRKAVAHLNRWGGEVTFGVQTEWTLGDLGAIQVQGSICPAFPATSTEPKESVEAKSAFFGYLGHSTGVKGLPLLMEAASLDPEGLYLAQINPKTDKLPPNVEPIYGEIDKAQYKNALARMDAVILPYDAGYYRNHISGVFIEALSSGRPVLIPQDTWMELEARKLGVGYETFKSGEVTSLLSSLKALRANWDTHYPKSVAATSKVREKYSVAKFLEWVEK